VDFGPRSTNLALSGEHKSNKGFLNLKKNIYINNNISSFLRALTAPHIRPYPKMHSHHHSRRQLGVSAAC